MCKEDNVLRFCLCEPMDAVDPAAPDDPAGPVDPEANLEPPYWRIDRYAPTHELVMGSVRPSFLGGDADRLEALREQLHHNATFDLAHELQPGDRLTIVLSESERYAFEYGPDEDDTDDASDLAPDDRPFDPAAEEQADDVAPGWYGGPPAPRPLPLEAGPPRRLKLRWHDFLYGPNDERDYAVVAIGLIDADPTSSVGSEG